jgi:nitrogen fixation protein FixH
MFPVFGLILAVNLLVAIVALVVWHTGGRRLASNAAEAYQKIYDEMYEATNDFLVTHGYEPIGFIQGYAMSTIREAPWR